MRNQFWYALALLSGLATNASTAYAQSPEKEILELRARLERLEQQNSELRQSMTQRLPVVESDDTVAKESFTGHFFDSPEDAKIRSVVQQYLNEQDAKKKAEAEAKKAAGYEVGTDLGMTGSWKNGLEFQSKNKDFRLHIGGRTQFDAGWFSVDPNVYTAAPGPNHGSLGNEYGDGVDFRRARLRLDGTMYEIIEFAAEYDFVNSATLGADSASGPINMSNQPRAFTAPTDLWWEIKELPVIGNLRIGNQKPQIGFEHIVSSRYLPFMERSFNQDTFYGGLFNGFVPGITAMNNYGGEEKIGNWALGVYKPTNNVFGFNTGNGDYEVTGRLTRLLWYEDNGRNLFHVGGSLQQGTAVSQAIGSNGSQSEARLAQFRTRDMVRAGLSANWPTPANITLFGDDQQTANLELAGVRGPWTFQAEYLVNSLLEAQARSGATGLPTGPNLGSVVYHGGYVQVLYFLTGESDNYSKERGAFDRVKPHENFFLVRDENNCRCFGTGAWQVGLRYDYLDLNDKGQNGGILHNGTVGLNWFLNPNMKIQFNYMATVRDTGLVTNAGDGLINGWGMRLAHDF